MYGIQYYLGICEVGAERGLVPSAGFSGERVVSAIN